jgi:prepilin-type N-terminal cleavage/methylation domain-containing protein
MKVKRKNQGFTLIELLVVITIIAVLASMAMPAYNKVQERAKIIKDTNNIKQIILACRTFASDNDGVFPSYDPEKAGGGEDSKFSTATEAFNVLVPDYVDTELIFWIQTKNPDKLRAPKEDGELEQNEVSYAYVVGQTDSSFSRSPLVADGEMDGPGTYGEYHPWLSSKKAVIGYCGGHVVEEKLTSNEPGATVKTKDGLIENIFEKREPGGGGGGLLDVATDNVLLP